MSVTTIRRGRLSGGDTSARSGCAPVIAVSATKASPATILLIPTLPVTCLKAICASRRRVRKTIASGSPLGQRRIESAARPFSHHSPPSGKPQSGAGTLHSLTNFTCTPEPDHPGWLRWRITDHTRYNEAVLGMQLVRRESETTCRTRMFPQALHTNSAGNVHGAVTLGFIDVSLFSSLYVIAGIDAGRSVTLDMTSQFIGSGDASRPLDCVVELLRETGRLCFLRGLAVQDDDLVASFTATVRKPSPAK